MVSPIDAVWLAMDSMTSSEPLTVYVGFDAFRSTSPDVIQNNQDTKMPPLVADHFATAAVNLQCFCKFFWLAVGSGNGPYLALPSSYTKRYKEHSVRNQA